MKIAYFSILTLLISTFSIAQTKSINEKKFIAIGGIEQWITIKGDDISQAVVLFIHGGPGSTMSQFTNSMYGEWEKDIESIQKLESLGVPPYNSAKNYGQLLRVVKSYERKNSISAPSTWFNLEAEYNNEKDSKDRYDGDDYSFVHFVGHEMLNIKSMVSKIDFNKNALNFKLPVYYIQGEEDILTSKEVNKPYFDKIYAPIKEYFLLKDAGHGHNKSVVDKQFEVVNKFKSSN